MKLTVPSHVVLATVDKGWPIIPKTIDVPPPTLTYKTDPTAAKDMQGHDTDGESFDGARRMRTYRVDDQLMVWVRIAPGVFVVFEQCDREPVLMAKFAKGIAILGSWPAAKDKDGYWVPTGLAAGKDAAAATVRAAWPSTWYPVTGHTGTFPNEVPTYNTSYPILGSIFQL